MANDNNDPNIPSRSNLGQRLPVTQLLFLVTNFSPHVSVYQDDTMTYAVQLYSKSLAREAAILVQGVL